VAQALQLSRFLAGLAGGAGAVRMHAGATGTLEPAADSGFITSSRTRSAMSDTVLAALEPLPQGGVELQSPEAARHIAATGLSGPGSHGRWTDGGRVRLVFRLPERPEGGVVLRLESLGYIARGFVNEPRAVMRVNGRQIAEWSVLDGVMRTRSLAVPADLLDESGRVVLELHISTSVQPALLGLGDDRRFLGLLLRRVSWQPRAARREGNPYLAERGRPVGRETRKSFDHKIDSGFRARFVTGPEVLDIGFQGGDRPGSVVPSSHLYERRRRVYTPSSLLAEFEAALVPNSYRVRHLAENDAGYQYEFPPNAHPEGCYEIELVVEKIAVPGWSMGE